MIVKIQDPSRHSYLSIPFESQLVRVDIKGVKVFVTPIFGASSTSANLKYCVAQCRTEEDAHHAAVSLLAHIQNRSNECWYFESEGDDDGEEDGDDDEGGSGWNTSQEG